MSYQSGKIVEKSKLSDSVMRLCVEPKKSFPHTMGQFIITRWEFDGLEKIADYTITSLPNSSGTFEIIVHNHQVSKAGAFLHSLPIGGEFTFKGPKGRFKLQGIDAQITMSYKGIGIAALYALLLDLSTSDYSGEINLYYFIQEGFEPILQDEISDLFPSIQLNVIFDLSSDWLRGKIRKRELEDLYQGTIDSNHYVAGESEFVRNLRKGLIGCGVEKEKLVREFFG